MSTRRLLPSATALWSGLAVFAALAQTPAEPARPASEAQRPAASVPRSKPIPRLLSPTESRDSATTPGDLRPERPVTPQISIRLGKLPPPAAPPPARPSYPGQPEPSATDEARDAARIEHEAAVARCEAQAGEQVREKCRDALARAWRAR